MSDSAPYIIQVQGYVVDGTPSGEHKGKKFFNVESVYLRTLFRTSDGCLYTTHSEARESALAIFLNDVLSRVRTDKLGVSRAREMIIEMIRNLRSPQEIELDDEET